MHMEERARILELELKLLQVPISWSVTATHPCSGYIGRKQLHQGDAARSCGEDSKWIGRTQDAEISLIRVGAHELHVSEANYSLRVCKSDFGWTTCQLMLLLNLLKGWLAVQWSDSDTKNEH